MAGREKVDLFLDVLDGGFGLLLVQHFAGVKLADQFLKINETLRGFSFPVVNFVFSASGRLREKDHNDLTVYTRLDELELRATVASAQNGYVKVIGLLPGETATSKLGDPAAQFLPNFSYTLGPVGLGLGLAISAFRRPRSEVLAKPFLAGEREFGWYVKSGAERSGEGVHHSAAVLQVDRNTEELQIKVALATDWEGGGVNNQTLEKEKHVNISHPAAPRTPLLMDITDPAKLPALLPKAVVSAALGEEVLKEMIDDKTLVRYGSETDYFVTRASLLALLEERAK